VKLHAHWIVRSKATWVQAWTFLAISALMAGISPAQEDVDQPVKTEMTLLDDKSISLEPNAPSDQSSSMEAEKKRKATAGLAAVGAIAILGVSVIALTMIWARRLRRLARDSGPIQRTAGNDFWFLRPPKPNATDAEISTTRRPLMGDLRDEEP
jgi:hypothetical protein